MDQRGTEAVIFDLDNTLLSSRIDYARMKREVLQDLVGLGAPPKELDESASIADVILKGKSLLARSGCALDDGQMDVRLGAILTARELDGISYVKRIDGASEVLASLRERGVPTAILTRGSRAYALQAMAVAGLNGKAGPCVCRDDHPLAEAKPHPISMSRAAALVGMRPSQCWYVGDNIMDLECAVASGARFIGVNTGSMNAERWERSGCEQCIESVADLPRALGYGTNR